MATSSKPRSPRAQTIRTAAIAGGCVGLALGLLGVISSSADRPPATRTAEEVGYVIGMIVTPLLFAAVVAGIGALIGLALAAISGASREVPDPNAVPAGWYPDPAGLPQHRYWDGTVWTEHTAPAGEPAPTAAPEPS